MAQINEEIYQRTLHFKNSGIISGTHERDVEIGDESSAVPWNSGIIKAFLEDDDIQEITIVSSCIGFVKTLTKKYKPR